MKVIALLPFLLAAALAADSPFVGSWKMNTEQSHFVDGSPELISAEITVNPAVANGLKFTDFHTNGEGRGSSVTYESQFDGKPSVMSGSQTVDSATFTKVNDRSLKAVAEKEGKVVYNDQIAVSADGKTMTIRRTGTAPDGKKYQSLIVLDRTK